MADHPMQASMHDVAVAYLTGEGWTVTQSDETPTLRFAFQSGDLGWDCYLRVNEDLQRVVFYSIPALNVPEEKRAEAMEYLTRANYGLPLGNFELDLRDGEIRYKTSLAVEGQALTPALLRHVIYANLATTGRYLPGLLGVVYGDMVPVEAVTRVEQTA